MIVSRTIARSHRDFLMATLSLVSLLLLPCNQLIYASSLRGRVRSGALPCVNDCSASLANFSVIPPIIPGECIDGECQCAQGFSGVDCSVMNRGAIADTGNIAVRAPLLVPDDVVTCTGKMCSSICAFGGSCIDDTTCSCNDHWGHGKSPAVSSAAAAVAASMDSGNEENVHQPNQSGEKMQLDRRPMTRHDRLALKQVLLGLGFNKPIPSGPNDPCLQPWQIHSSAHEDEDNSRPNPILVRCHIDGNVTELDLSRLGLRGQLVPQVGNFRNLRTLSLHNNAIAGTLPITLGNLEQLEYLLVYKNQIGGSIPQSISKCKSLIAFIAYSNELTGELPATIGYLRRSLQNLDVSFNRLSGDIPGSIGTLVYLIDLDISHNEFTGFIPESIQKITSLKRFRYSDNRFSNTVLNVGNTDVWSDSENRDLAEKTYDEWKDGLASESLEKRQPRLEEERRKELADEASQIKEAAESAISAKVQKMLPPAFRTGGEGDDGGGDLPNQVSEIPTIDGT